MRTKFEIGFILALKRSWTYEDELEVRIIDLRDTEDLETQRIVECRGKFHDGPWEMYDWGSNSANCQWRLTPVGYTVKKALQKNGWYLDWE